MAVYTCEICGGEFEHPREKKTCSRECANKARSRSTQSQWERRGDEMAERVSEAMQTDEIREHMRRTQLGDDNSMAGRTGEANPAYRGKITFECEWCGETFSDHPSREGERRFCSPTCRATWQSENMAGENAGPWKGGHPGYYGENWSRQRGRALERDDGCCVICGRGEDELGQKPDVHHITPLREFDTPEEANVLDNLVTLCRGHHQMVEGWGLIPLTE